MIVEKIRDLHQNVSTCQKREAQLMVYVDQVEIIIKKSRKDMLSSENGLEQLKNALNKCKCWIETWCMLSRQPNDNWIANVSTTAKKIFKSKTFVEEYDEVVSELQFSLQIFGISSSIDDRQEQQKKVEELIRQKDKIFSNKDEKEPDNYGKGGGKIYKVVIGDTLSEIAKKIYGDEKEYERIAKANDLPNPNFLYVGQNLIIPELSNELPILNNKGKNEKRENKKDDDMDEYIVEPGDSLRDIAIKLYGDDSKCLLIEKANKFNPETDTLKPGQRLKIPKINPKRRDDEWEDLLEAWGLADEENQDDVKYKVVFCRNGYTDVKKWSNLNENFKFLEVIKFKPAHLQTFKEELKSLRLKEARSKKA